MTKRVLLCDDEPHILRAAEIKLKRSGFEVVTAFNGEKGWQAIQQERPDIVITDCQMPILDGLGLAKRIHEDPSLRAIPVVMLTAKGFELSGDELREKYGIIELMIKPFSPRQIVERVTQILDGPVAAVTTGAVPTL
jgi:DNA-binding response OmpR family regulator